MIKEFYAGGTLKKQAMFQNNDEWRVQQSTKAGRMLAGCSAGSSLHRG